MNETNTVHPETLFHQSISHKVDLFKSMIRAHPRPVKGKAARRSPNWRQHQATVLTKTLQHRKSCIQGYRAKARLAKDGKGHNTTSGIPETFLALV